MVHLFSWTCPLYVDTQHPQMQVRQYLTSSILTLEVLLQYLNQEPSCKSSSTLHTTEWDNVIIIVHLCL